MHVHVDKRYTVCSMRRAGCNLIVVLWSLELEWEMGDGCVRVNASIRGLDISGGIDQMPRIAVAW